MQQSLPHRIVCWHADVFHKSPGCPELEGDEGSSDSTDGGSTGRCLWPVVIVYTELAAARGVIAHGVCSNRCLTAAYTLHTDTLHRSPVPLTHLINIAHFVVSCSVHWTLSNAAHMASLPAIQQFIVKANEARCCSGNRMLHSWQGRHVSCSVHQF